MSKPNHNAQRLAAIALVLSASVALGQGIILIGPSTQNGSFEDGVASPWRGIQAVNDSSFARAGEWYGVLQDTAPGPTARVVASQLFPPNSEARVNPDNGLTFTLTFYARNGAMGFDTISSYINAWNADGTVTMASPTPISSPPLSGAGWVEYATVFQLPETWDGDGNFIVGIQFTKQGAVIGTTYTGYLDNIVLQQIPEPSSLALVLCGGALWLAARGPRRNERGRSTHRFLNRTGPAPAGGRARWSHSRLASGGRPRLTPRNR